MFALETVEFPLWTGTAEIAISVLTDGIGASSASAGNFERLNPFSHVWSPWNGVKRGFVSMVDIGLIIKDGDCTTEVCKYDLVFGEWVVVIVYDTEPCLKKDAAASWPQIWQTLTECKNSFTSRKNWNCSKMYISDNTLSMSS